MASATSHLIPPEGLLKLRYYYFVRKWGKDVIFMIFKYTFLHGSSKSIRQILEDSGVSFGRKSPFTDSEVDNITRNSPEDLDITALNKVCQVLWGKGVNNPGETLCNLVKKIKSERNDACHGEGNISESELDDKLKEFGQTLENALDEAKKIHVIHETNFDILKVEVTQAIPKIKEKIREKYDPNNPDDLKKLQEEIEEFGILLYDFVHEKAEKELVSHYTVLCRMLPFDWLAQYDVVSPCEFMVTLRMDTTSKFHKPSEQDIVTFDQSEILEKRDPANNDPNVIIVSGDAGSGKSTILLSIIEKWHKKTNTMPNLSTFQVLLYMQFRVHKYDNFDSYLQDLLQHTITILNFNQVKSAVLNSKCLILCDGFDESNPKSLKFFKEILEMQFKNMKIIVTTRPGKEEELTSLVNKSKHHRLNLSILGLRKDDMESHVTTLTNYLIKDNTKRTEISQEIIQFLKAADSPLKQILQTPLWFNLFILLFVECPNLRGQISNPTMLYLQLKKHNKKRLKEKLEVGEKVIEEFDKVYTKWSLQYFIQRKFELSEEDTAIFERKCVDLGLDFQLVMSSYFIIKHTYRDLDLSNVYCYRHLSEQEYNASIYICDKIRRFYEDEQEEFKKLMEQGKNVMENFLSDVTDITSRTRLLVFITGILYNKDNDLLQLVLDNIIDLHYECTRKSESVIEHLFEARNAEYACLKMSELFHRENWTELTVGSSVTLFCLPELLPRIKLNSLSIHVEEDTSEDTHLIPALEAASQNNIKIKLIHIAHYFSDSCSLNDQALEAAKTCTSFQGKLSENGIKTLPPNIECLYLRMEFHHLSAFLCRLKDLKHLKELELFFHYDGTVDPACLAPFDYKGTRYHVQFSTSLDLNLQPNVEKLAAVLNALWPKSIKDEYLSLIKLIPQKTHDKLTGDSIRTICELLQIVPCTFWIVRTSDEARKKKGDLGALWRSKNGGSLTLF